MPPFDIDRWPVIASAWALTHGRLLVLADVDTTHRVWLSNTAPGQPLAYIIPADGATDQRIAATRRLDLRMSGVPPDRCPPASRPTSFQTRRLRLLLAILDAVLVPGEGRPSTHEIASRLIYPRLTVGRGAEWKASSERRRTQRLIDEALAVMNGGYRALLNGNLAGATKRAGPK